MCGGNGHFQYSKGNNSKSKKTRVTVHLFCMSSHGVNICVKFHENMSRYFKVMERTQKLLTDTHKKKENYIPHCSHTSYAVGITRFMGHVFCMSSHGVKIYVKFHESMSSGF